MRPRVFSALVHVASFSGLSFVVCKETRETDKATPRENFAMKMEIEILFTLTCALGLPGREFAGQFLKLIERN